MEIIRDGSYAVHDGKEYRLVPQDDGNFRLVSRNPEDIKNGFKQREDVPTIYRKIVSRSEIQSASYVRALCIYKGYEVGALSDGSKDGTAQIGIDYVAAEKLGFENIDIREGGVRTVVQISDIEKLWEEQHEYENFPMTPGWDEIKIDKKGKPIYIKVIFDRTVKKQ